MRESGCAKQPHIARLCITAFEVLLASAASAKRVSFLLVFLCSLSLSLSLGLGSAACCSTSANHCSMCVPSNSELLSSVSFCCSSFMHTLSLSVSLSVLIRNALTQRFRIRPCTRRLRGLYLPAAKSPSPSSPPLSTSTGKRYVHMFVYDSVFHFL